MPIGGSKKFRKKLNKLTFGLFDTFLDLSLFCFFAPFAFAETYKSGKDVFYAINEALKLTKITNVNSFNRIIYKAKNKNYLEKKQSYLEITHLGKERLLKILPKYEAKRPWDGILYLITYDIPEEKRKFRDYLRNYLKKLGCGLLQKSVWITPYNPKKHIIDYVKNTDTYELILVSELKEGSNIGGKDMRDVLEKVYNLKEINQQYQNFFQQVEQGKVKGIKLIIYYLSILKEDPQLPFELMRDNYWGEAAYEIYRNELKKRS